MKIYLKKIHLLNFKGARLATYDFNKESFVYGANGTGKTTIFDAFLWLLFGKDSTDRKDFEIKTLDSDNVAIPRLDHEVSATLIVDDEEITLKRSLREKWVKKRGSEKQEFDGHETAFYYNEVPMNQKDYQSKISSIIDEKVFRSITNIYFFNSLHWSERRAVLIDMAGPISIDSVIQTLSGGETVSQLRNALNKGKSIEEFKKEIASKKKLLKEDLLHIPARIEEANRNKPEPVDEASIRSEMVKIDIRLNNIDEAISSKSKSAEQFNLRRQDLIREKGKLQELLINIENAVKQKANEAQNTLSAGLVTLKGQISEKELWVKDSKIKVDRVRQSIDDKANQISILEQEVNSLREKWGTLNTSEIKFNDVEFCCPTCKRELEATDIEAKKESLIQEFNKDKQKQLSSIAEAGKQKATSISELEKQRERDIYESGQLIEEISKAESDIESLKKQYQQDLNTYTQNESTVNDTITQTLFTDKLYNDTKAQIESIELDLQKAPEENIAADYSGEKKELIQKRDALNKQLTINEQIAKIDERVAQLEQEEKNLSQQLASLEGLEFTIESYDKAMMAEVESAINKNFKLVKWKMFEEQINGGTSPTCIATVNGVPFSELNQAMKVNAGIDIINAIADYYQASAPIFIDCRESVTELIPTEHQVINLIVSPTHKAIEVK